MYKVIDCALVYEHSYGWRSYACTYLQMALIEGALKHVSVVRRVECLAGLCAESDARV